MTRPFWLPLAAVLLTSTAVAAATITVSCDRDTTLIEHPSGALANGVGPSLFVGRTSQPQGRSVRRALLHFDLSGVPRHARIEDVRLVMNVSQSQSASPVIAVHRVIRDWGVGMSSTTGGSGVPSQPGDATWLHTFFEPMPPGAPATASSSTSMWVQPGGDFAPSASASQTVAGIGTHSWSSAELVRDVRKWLKNPKRNYGWILVGGEEGPSTAHRFESRESMMFGLQPRLEIDIRD